MSKHILVPVDESDRAKQALEFAFSEYPSARITALHVIDPSELYAPTGLEGGTMVNYDQIRENQERRTEGVLEMAQEMAREHGLEIETDHVMGRVSRSIVDYVEENDVDQIVIGSHGRRGASRILLGSVAENVVRRSSVPVTIVR